MIYVIIALGLIFGSITAYRLVSGRRVLVDEFSRCNVIVFGKKGTGKDLIFNAVINARKRRCSANIQYNSKYCTIRDVKEYSVAPNTYRNFLDGNITIVDKVLPEREDYYISDGGIILPSQYQSDLVKLYPSLPIYYALSRHLQNSNVHINTQALGRVWDKLREQADCYIKAIRSFTVFGLVFTRFIVYDEYESAKLGLRPYHHSILSRQFSKANAEEFEALHGRVESHIIVQRKSRIKYDTRAYHSKLYGMPAPADLRT